MTEKIDYSAVSTRCGANAETIVKAMEAGDWGGGSTALIQQLAGLKYRQTLRALHRLKNAGFADQCESFVSRYGWGLNYHLMPLIPRGFAANH